MGNENDDAYLEELRPKEEDKDAELARQEQELDDLVDEQIQDGAVNGQVDDEPEDTKLKGPGYDEPEEGAGFEDEDEDGDDEGEEPTHHNEFFDGPIVKLPAPRELSFEEQAKKNDRDGQAALLAARRKNEQSVEVARQARLKIEAAKELLGLVGDPPVPRPIIGLITERPLRPLWKAPVKPEPYKEQKPLEVSWLPKSLQQVLKAWPMCKGIAYDHFDVFSPLYEKLTVPQQSQVYREFLARPPCPWCSYWREDPKAPEVFTRCEDLLCYEVQDWLEKADPMTPDMEQGLRVIAQHAAKLRCLVVLCDAFQDAQGKVYKELGRKSGDEDSGWMFYKRKLFNEPTYMEFKVLTKWVFDHSPHGKQKRKESDRQRNDDPDRRAAKAAYQRARRAKWTPEQKAAEAKRKANERAAAKRIVKDFVENGFDVIVEDV